METIRDYWWACIDLETKKPTVVFRLKANAEDFADAHLDCVEMKVEKVRITIDRI